MKIIRKLAEKTADPMHHEGVTIAFLGDSVTQGCFEIYKKENAEIETVFDKRHSYEMYVLEILNILFPAATVNIINAGISGDRSEWGLARVERDVIRHAPDLTVVCYGLNDCGREAESIGRYTMALEGIFQKLRASGSEIIFLTPNMMNTRISPYLTDADFIKMAGSTAELQNDGIFNAHIDAAKDLCRKMKVAVCDCYGIWNILWANGVDTTELLSNKINHPTRDMNKLFAYELVKTMFTTD